MRGANIECKVNNLASGPGLYVGGVVGVFEAFAKPDVAFRSVVIGLGGRNLEFALDIAIGVGRLVVVDLLAACCFHCGAGETWSWRGNTAVGRDGREETC